MSTSTSLADRLAAVVGRHASPEGAAWFAPQLAAARSPAARPRAEFEMAFSGARRRLGSAPLPAGAEAEAGDASAAIVIAGRALDEIARVALILADVEAARPGEDPVALVKDLFYHGEMREKEAVLRALPLLPDAARYLELPMEACRSSVQSIFDAVACENPYPADHFSDSTFNQMVLKALFVQTSVARIVGLDRRVTDELVKMARYYGSERRAAGRTVPEDIEYIARLPRRAS